MKYKALFLDIDDTLVGSDKRISDKNLEAIRRAQANGIFVTIATGRGYLGATGIWKKLDISGPVIVYGGARVMDTRTDEEVFSAPIDPELIKEALECAQTWGIHCQIYQEDTVIFARENGFTQVYTSYLRLPYVVDPDIMKKEWHNVPKMLAYAEPGEQEREMLARFSKHFYNRLEVASSKPGFIELNRFGMNKGTAMLRTAELLGISQAETVAVGDNTLDLQMIEMAGLGVCVENGQQAVKDAASVIAPACEEDGVAWVIDNILLQ
ncbi:MAG TPA: Cof-type HAD-IIB family hydrolase [Feifaniaceae bacterium]|nr:Cof-type HAD-IIB family hydrolase [Feifaniaceae bacterium]